ncbi:hypothetical protein BB560_003279 [Smittium megazygosporum]|uniref:Uncharacterized protein n=1 Tax=Smittium megazygosporum TaxID=133381 RepID=A0A2T9ZCJ7_9FUNG|nr:hypothetical protein BB560_003279 [Smittium megazygosporum]
MKLYILSFLFFFFLLISKTKVAESAPLVNANTIPRVSLTQFYDTTNIIKRQDSAENAEKLEKATISEEHRNFDGFESELDKTEAFVYAEMKYCWSLFQSGIRSKMFEMDEIYGKFRNAYIDNISTSIMSMDKAEELKELEKDLSLCEQRIVAMVKIANISDPVWTQRVKTVLNGFASRITLSGSLINLVNSHDWRSDIIGTYEYENIIGNFFLTAFNSLKHILDVPTHEYTVGNYKFNI